MIRLFPALLGALALYEPETAVAETQSRPQAEYVVLLHGLGRTSLSMKGMEYYLKKHGYEVINMRYPSTRFCAEELADVYLDRLLREKIPDGAAKIHFVTHSFGGIIVRQYLSNHSMARLGRVVMLAPPNHGSEIIDHLKGSAFARWLLGPGAFELGTDANDLPKRLGPVAFECGVIVGDRSLNHFFSRLMPGPNDGKVTVESAKVEGEADFAVIHSNHTWLMWRWKTWNETRQFLETGNFGRQNGG